VLAGIGQSVRDCHRWWHSWTSGRHERRCSLAGGQTQESLAEEGLTRISIELLLSSCRHRPEVETDGLADQVAEHLKTAKRTGIQIGA
jgi:hypothetical protein